MKNIFPTEGASVIVSDDMCDMNGHMNVRFYQTIPMDYDDNFYNSLVGKDYIDTGFSFFTAEQNIRYLKECLKGEKLTPRFRMLNANKKLKLGFVPSPETLRKIVSSLRKKPGLIESIVGSN